MPPSFLCNPCKSQVDVLYLMHIPRMLAHQRAQLPACSRHLPHIASPTCSWHSPSPSTSCCASSAAAPHAGFLQQGSSQEPSLPPQAPHIPVLLRPILECFQPLKMRSYVDGTLGAGGHACAMLQAHPELEMLVGIDLDPTAHAIAGARLRSVAPASTSVQLMRGNYREVRSFLSSLPAPPSGSGPGTSLHGNVDAMLLDLGVSSMQIDTPERGFSFMRDGPLDMRLDPQAVISAEEVVNTWSEAELGRIIRDYGEEKLWRQVARRILAARAGGVIRTTAQLVDAIGQTQLSNSSKGGKKGDHKRIHPATRTFQALRIAVNDEINKLEQALPEAIDALALGGRLAIISFHSLEDRAVKRAFSRACGKPTPEEEHLTYGPNKFEFLDSLEARAVAKLVTRKPVLADEQEMRENSRSRSAKLRVLERVKRL